MPVADETTAATRDRRGGVTLSTVNGAAGREMGMGSKSIFSAIQSNHNAATPGTIYREAAAPKIRELRVN